MNRSIPFLSEVTEPGYEYKIRKLHHFLKRWIRAKADRAKNYPRNDSQWYAAVHGDFKEALATIMLLEQHWLDWCHYGFNLRRRVQQTLMDELN